MTRSPFIYKNKLWYHFRIIFQAQGTTSVPYMVFEAFPSFKTYDKMLACDRGLCWCATLGTSRMCSALRSVNRNCAPCRAPILKKEHASLWSHNGRYCLVIFPGIVDSLEEKTCIIMANSELDCFDRKMTALKLPRFQCHRRVEGGGAAGAHTLTWLNIWT